MNQKKRIYGLLLALFFVFSLSSMTAYAMTGPSPSITETVTPTEIANQDKPNDSDVEEVDSQKSDISIAQIITSGGVIITAMLGIANLAATNKKMRIEGISNKRAQWIESVRKITASIVCCDLRRIKDSAQFEKEYNELLRNAYLLSLYLNIQGPFDRVVFDYLTQLVKFQYQRSDNLVENRRMLNFAVQVYLKSEWNRVKCESDPKQHDKYNEKNSITTILGGLTGKYVDQLKEKYTYYLNGGIMEAPIFTEFADISCK